MAERWVRLTLTAELLSDAHFGSGSGGGGIDALVARDRHDRPVIWASHVEGVLRDAACRLRGPETAGDFFGRAGGDRQRALFTSLYTSGSPERHIWRAASRESFDNRAPRDETLRVVEYVPRGTRFVGQVELPASQEPVLRRLVQEVDGLGAGRAAGSGRVKLSLAATSGAPRSPGTPAERLVLLLKSRDPLCITAIASLDNLIPSFSFVPGRALLGAMAAWLITEGDRETASLLTSGKVFVSDALPVPDAPARIEAAEVLPAPLVLQSEKPRGAAGDVPWWAQPRIRPQRLNAWDMDRKLKRPEDDLFVYRDSEGDPWSTYCPAHRVRLRNARPDVDKRDVSLFAVEQIAEKTHFLAELQGTVDDMGRLARVLAPVLSGVRWLRVGSGAAPVEVLRFAWCRPGPVRVTTGSMLLTLTSDLLIRDEHLRWRTTLNEATLRTLVGQDIQIEKEMQDNVMAHGFNGTSRLWRMPAAAIRRGSVFKVSGPGVAQLARMAVHGQWLGERPHEGFGRFRLDAVLPGVTHHEPQISQEARVHDADEEVIAMETRRWYETHQELTKAGDDRRPSLSQWPDLVTELDRGDAQAIDLRLAPATVGARRWMDPQAKAVLERLKAIKDASQRASHARLFVRWLRADLRRKAT